ncbi:hypothetical protein [Nonomuraea jabiensis]|uniref:Uncharacterized protein n=1 Tax=Nonomuraea jabiensis TaxID=882448 RepID=A0A7W9GEE5_9ACTN|nr:hypothetical protein [Nonomuraea jabiensis]MBB5782314.1 hypothetical protein [Nonomuraea jabiensis]
MHAEDGHQFVLARLADGTRYDVIVVDLPDEAPDSDAQHNRLYTGRSVLQQLGARVHSPLAAGVIDMAVRTGTEPAAEM